MKVTEIYISKENIPDYTLHESLGTGYSKLIEIAADSISRAIETYNSTIDNLTEKNETEKIENLNINDFISAEEMGLKAAEDLEFNVNINEEDLIPFEDYYVYDNKIIFNEPVEIGSIIQIADNVNKTKIITKNSYNKNALLHVFSAEQKLKYNNSYSFKLNINEEEFETYFESQFDPYYSSVKKIREDLGSMINGVKDGQIAKLIFEHSKEVFYVLTNNGSEDDLTDIKKLMYPQNIVRYKTDIDLCWLLYYAVSGKYGTISKKIENIEIEKQTKLPYIETMLKRFQDALKELEDQLNNGTGTILSFTKGGDTKYTVSDRGVF